MDPKENRNIIIINKYKDSIYCLKSNKTNFITPYISYNKLLIDRYLKLKKDSSMFLDDRPRSWDEYIYFSTEGKMRLFIITCDTVNKYGWENILKKNIYTKLYLLTIEDLNKINWTITFDGK